MKSALNILENLDLRSHGVQIAENLRHETLAFSESPTGIPKAALTEFYGPAGSGKTSSIIKLLEEHPDLRPCWIENGLTINPQAVAQKGVDIKRLLFIDIFNHTELLFWSALQTVRSQLFDIVIIAIQSIKKQTEVARHLRRLQIEARTSGTIVLFLSETPLSLDNSHRWMFARSLQFGL